MSAPVPVSPAEPPKLRSPLEVPSGGRPDEIRAALVELVRLKDVKDRFGETEDYRANKDRAWAEARRLLGL